MFTLVDLILLIYMVFQKFINCYLSLSIFLFTLLFTLLLFLFSLKYVRKDLPSKHFLFSKTSSRRLEDVFRVALFRLPRRLQNVFQNVLQLCLGDVFKTSWKTKKCYTEDIFKTSSVRLHQDECLLGDDWLLLSFFWCR